MLLRWEDVYNASNLMQQRILLWDEVGGGYRQYVWKEMKIRIHNTRGMQVAKQVFSLIK